MSDLPKSVHINEEGPREGFQIESADIPTARKVDLIDALSETGLEEIGINTGIDLDRLIACARLAEEIVGHPLPGSVKLGGPLDKLRASVH